MTSSDKRFLTILGSITAVCVSGLAAWAFQSSSKYDAAKEQFDGVKTQIESMESLPLYPTEENLEAKKVSLELYKKSSADLQSKLLTYRPLEIKNVEPQEFTDNLKKATASAKAAYAKNGLSADSSRNNLPNSFFLGFETYSGALAQRDATGLLNYQLGALTELNLSLAAANPERLINIHRPAFPEESNEKYVATTGNVLRSLPVELIFSGSEQTLRAFVNSIIASKNYYYVIKTLRITNQKQIAPKAQDAEFKQETLEEPTSTGSEELPSPEDFAVGAEKKVEPAPKLTEKQTGQILKQVLGQEKINVFMRINIELFDANVKIP
jgi:hypothetical protein